MNDTLFQEVADGALLITVNRRLSRLLGQQVNDWQLARGERVWPTPAILPLEAWWRQCHQELLAEAAPRLPILLDTAGERLLWQRVIAADPLADQMMGLPQAAARCQEAWTLLRHYRLRLPEEEAAGNPEAEAFLAWSHTFEQELRQRRLLPAAALPERLLAWREQLDLPARAFLAGFDQFTPQQEHFFAALTASGMTCVRLPFPEQPGEGFRIALADGEEELATIARWCRARLEEDPTRRLGVVLPGLQGRREAIIRHFTRVFDPEAWHPLAPPRPLPFNLSGGPPLARAPLVRDALALLDLAREEASAAGWEAVFNSPYLAHARQERFARSRLQALMAARGPAAATLRETHRLAEAGGECPELARRLRGYQDNLAREGRARLSPSRWAMTFSRWLGLWGWPGDRGLSSEEHQTLAAWSDLLATLAGLDRVSDPIPLAEALALVRRLAEETLFQPETPETPIQILGVLEAGGESFDALWLAGCHDQAWPPTPEPNPFLPMGWQRRHGLPRASAARELDVAQAITRRLLTAAPRVMVSHPRQEQERQHRPSPLLSHLPEVTLEGLALSATAISPAAPLERLRDDNAPPLAPGELPRGGSGLIQSQAQCPFQAFARHRLHARHQPPVEPGLDPGLRGELVHLLLQKFWKETGDSAALHALTGQERQERITRVAREAVATQASVPDVKDRFTPRLAQLEEERLAQLLDQWLHLESQRPSFTVASLEKELPVTLGGITLSVRLDRVDRLEGGEQVLLDYKTGRMKPRGWESPPLTAPQLPLYTLALAEEEVAAVAFARLVTGKEMDFTGLSREPEVLPKVKIAEDWRGQCHLWRQELTRLAEAFQRGEAAVTPEARADPCSHCDLLLLCRKPMADTNQDEENGQEKTE